MVSKLQERLTETEIKTWKYMTLNLVKYKLQEVYKVDAFKSVKNTDGEYLSNDAIKALRLIDDLIKEYKIAY